MSKTVEKAVAVVTDEKNKMVVYDDHSEKNVVVTVEMQEAAWFEHDKIKGSIMQIASSLHRIKEKKLYLALGFNNFKDYCESAGFSKRSGYRYAAIGDGVEQLGLEPGEQNSALGGTNTLESLGVKKMYELFRLSQDQINQLLSGEEIAGGNGEKISLKDLQDMNVATASKVVSGMTKSKKDNQVGKLKADNALLNAEKKALMDQIKSMEKEVAAARTLEDKYGPTDTRLKDKLARLGQAQEHLGGFYRAINKAGVNPDDPPDVLDIFSALVGSLERTLEENKPTWHSIILTKEAE